MHIPCTQGLNTKVNLVKWLQRSSNGLHFVIRSVQIEIVSIQFLHTVSTPPNL